MLALVYDIAIIDHQPQLCNQQNRLDRIDFENPSINFPQISIYSNTMQILPLSHTDWQIDSDFIFQFQNAYSNSNSLASDEPVIIDKLVHTKKKYFKFFFP